MMSAFVVYVTSYMIQTVSSATVTHARCRANEASLARDEKTDAVEVVVGQTGISLSLSGG